MSVLIKGMEKPDNCEVCPYAFCHLDTKNCPIIELPDHGDLIDRDVLDRLAVQVWLHNSDGNDAMEELIHKLREEVSAVILAERSEE